MRGSSLCLLLVCAVTVGCSATPPPDLPTPTNTDGRTTEVPNGPVAVVDSIDVGGQLWAAAVDQDTGAVFTYDTTSESVVVVSDDRGEIGRIPNVDNAPGLTVFDGELYVPSGSCSEGAVDVYDTVELRKVDSIPTGIVPTTVAVDPQRNLRYVVNHGCPEAFDSSVTVVDESLTVTHDFPIDRAAGAAAVDPNTGLLYVTRYLSSEGGFLLVIDPAQSAVLTRVGTPGPFAGAVALDTDMSSIYVTDAGGSVTRLDLQNPDIQQPIAIGGSPVDIVIDTDTHTAYITDGGLSTVYVVDTRTNQLTTTLDVGARPTGLALDTAAHVVHVATEDGTIVVIGHE